jgi:hypothetical protein
MEIGREQMKLGENVALALLTVLLFFTIIPIVAYSQSAYEKAMEEYSICDYCGYKAFYDGMCGHCGFMEKE